MLQLMCEGILFDLDGVLIDSSACITRNWEKWARMRGVDLATVMRIAHGVRTVETIRTVAPHLDAEREAEILTSAEVSDTEGVTAIDGAQALLRNLPPDRWAIVTSGSRELAMARLARAGLPIPTVLVSGSDVQHGKPAPEPYLEGARRLGRRPERCLAVEDAPAGIESARAAGMQVVAIAFTHPKRDLDSPIVVERLSALRTELGSEGEPRLLVNVPAE